MMEVLESYGMQYTYDNRPLVKNLNVIGLYEYWLHLLFISVTWPYVQSIFAKD